MKKLPLGTHTFKDIILENNVYVDKTKDIYNLINDNSKYFFLSRPRRFGKSLLVSTLKELFSGNKELFKDLWIYEKIEFKNHPVIKIDFSSMSYMKPEDLEKSISLRLDRIASDYKIKLNKDLNYKDKFKSLIELLSEKIKIVILIDEYDKPIIDFIDNTEIAIQNRKTLKHFYETIKACDEYIRFTLLTGVSKFSKVSVFSGLNNLNDITLDSNYSTMLGYTESELHKYFKENIAAFANKYNISVNNLNKEIKDWYNGYSWDGENFVYNPFSILAFFNKLEFGNYWFNSGTPTFLIEQIKKHNTNIQELESFSANPSILDSFDINNINVESLLFQTGYLTIKSIDRLSISRVKYTLSYPNLEVKESLIKYILAGITESFAHKSETIVEKLTSYLEKNNIDLFIKESKSLFSSIPYNLIIKDKEAYYHTIFYLALSLIGVYIDCEVLTSKGRIDAVIQTDANIYIIEFKLGKAEKALKQIEKLEYHKKFLSSKKQITLIGIGFDIENRNINDYLVKKIEK